MAIIFDDADAADFSNWTATGLGDGGTELSVQQVTVAHGVNAYKATVDDNDVLYMRWNPVSGQSEIYWMFYFMVPSGWTLNTADIFWLNGLFETGAIRQLLELKEVSGVLKLQAMYGWGAGASNHFGTDEAMIEITEDIWHVFKGHWKAESAADQNDGISEGWLDGVQIFNKTNVPDSDTHVVNRCYGAYLYNFAVAPLTPDLTVYLDDFKIDDAAFPTIGGAFPWLYLPNRQVIGAGQL